MAQIGNKQNSHLNGQWGKHGQKSDKRVGNKARRKVGKKLCWLWNAVKERARGR